MSSHAAKHGHGPATESDTAHAGGAKAKGKTQDVELTASLPDELDADQVKRIKADLQGAVDARLKMHLQGMQKRTARAKAAEERKAALIANT